jgi:hypothetical protein
MKQGGLHLETPYCVVLILYLSQRRLGIAFKACLRYIHNMKRRLDQVSHLELTVTGTLLVDNAKIKLLSFLYKIHFASSARTRNLTVPPHRTLATSQSFVVLGCRAWNSLQHDVKRLLAGRFILALRGMYRSLKYSHNAQSSIGCL